MTGRPSSFTQEVADEICTRLARGESLRSITADQDSGWMPSQTTVFRWLEDNAAFREQYARAREVQADTIFDEMLEIADDARNDFMERQLGEDGPTVLQANQEHIQRSRLRIETRKWMAGKLRPKVYGDKVVNEHSGPDGGAIETKVTFEFVKPGEG